VAKKFCIQALSLFIEFYYENYLLCLVLFNAVLITSFASEKIYIQIGEDDTLSSLLFSVGSVPLYGQIGAVEIHQVVYNSIC
jgi:hypothetical protein